MAKILHLVTDEKFTDYAISQFSAPEMESEFVLIPCNFLIGESEVKLIHKVKVMSPNSEDFTRLLSHLGDYSAIVLHGLFWPKWQIPILQCVPSYVKLAWVFWGGDLFGYPELKRTYFGPISKWAIKIHDRKRKSNSFETPLIPKELCHRVDYFFTDQEEDLVTAQNFLHTHMKFLPYSYYSIEDTIGILKDKRCEGCNIMVCHSAEQENNLYETLLFLYKYYVITILRGRKLIVPLSYGATWLRNSINRLGKLLFGKAFFPLNNYLPRDEYNSYFLSCSVMINGAHQPIAQGNIITALWLGLRVYLSEKNMTYHYFKRLGVNIYTIEHDFKLRNKHLLEPLSESELQQTRKILTDVYSRETCNQYNKQIVEELLNK